MLFKLPYLIKSFALFCCIFITNTCLASTNFEQNSEILVNSSSLSSSTNTTNAQNSTSSTNTLSEFGELNDFNESNGFNDLNNFDDLNNFETKNKKNNWGNTSNKPSFLPADKAFIPEIIVNKDNSIDVSFFIAPKCYLYKERFTVRINSNSYNITQTNIPDGEYHDDEYMGPSHIFKESVSLKVYLDKIKGKLQDNIQGNLQDNLQDNNQNNLSASENQINEIKVVYQGCTEGVCYPPITKVFSINDFVFNEELSPNGLKASNTLNTSSLNINNQENYKEHKDSNELEGKKLESQKLEVESKESTNDSNAKSIYNKIKNSNILIGLGIFFCFGVLLSMTPCMFPMYPIWSAIILGNKQKNFKTSLIYS